MKSIKIVTDSTVDVPAAVLAEHGVEVVPLHLTVDGEAFVDRVTITPGQFMAKMKAARELPKSSQPSVGEFLAVFDSYRTRRACADVLYGRRGAQGVGRSLKQSDTG